jgi:hypothetical protein
MKIAFVCGSQNKTPYSEFMPLSKYFYDNGIESFFVLDKKVDPEIKQSLIDNNANFYLENIKYNTITNNAYIKNNKKQVRKVFLKKVIPYFLRVIIKQFSELIVKYKFFIKTDNLIEDIFNLEQPDAIILYGDRAKGMIPSSIKWIRKNNKTIIDLQIAISDENFYYNSRKSNFYFSTKNPFNFIFSILFPNYKKCFKGECVLFDAWSTILILWSKNMLPANPWYLGQSWADHFLIISKQSYNDLLTLYPSVNNTTIVGQYSHDLLFKTFNNKDNAKRKLIEKYFAHMKTDQEIILFSMPQFYEHNLFTKEKAMSEIEYILDNLAKISNKLILLSLHPKMPYEKYSYINEKYQNIKVLKDERLNEALPIADYFISIFESTISWALMCEVLPIFLDYYYFGFNMNKYKSVQNLKNRSLFLDDIQLIISNKNEIIKNISKDKKLLPPFDGKSGSRILNKIKMSIK